jgi:hypothetical protein
MPASAGRVFEEHDANQPAPIRAGKRDTWSTRGGAGDARHFTRVTHDPSLLQRTTVTAPDGIGV